MALLLYHTDLQACKQHNIHSRRGLGSYEVVWNNEIVWDNKIVWKPHSSCPILLPAHSLSLTGRVQKSSQGWNNSQALTKKGTELCGSHLLTSKQRLNLILWYKPRIKIEKMKVCMRKKKIAFCFAAILALYHLPVHVLYFIYAYFYFPLFNFALI